MINPFERFDKIREILIERNRFYSKRLKDPKTFEEIPFTTKSELVEDQTQNPPFGTDLTYPVENYVRIHQTSGTAGKPLAWLDTKESWDWWLRCWAEVYSGANVRAGDRVYVAFSFGPFIGFWATPTYALRLAEVAAQQGIDLVQGPIRTTVHAGEPGASIPETRRRIQEAFGARTFDHVGMTEMGAYGFECEMQSGLHINEDEFIVEMIDPGTLRPVDPGTKGEMVLTNLGRLGSPLIRYRTGDLGVLSREPCACGRQWARLMGGVLGRADDMITIRGVNVFPSAIENIVRRHSQVVEFAIEVSRRREMHELSLKVELENSAGEIIERLRADISKNLNIRATIEHVPAGSLPRFELKSRRLRVVD